MSKNAKVIDVFEFDDTMVLSVETEKEIHRVSLDIEEAQEIVDKLGAMITDFNTSKCY